jgi:mRNA interferase HigB
MKKRPDRLHVISHKKLLEAAAAAEHSGLGTALDAWYRIARAPKSKWTSLEEVRKSYPHADGVKVGDRVYTVFNMCGNSFRLITEIFYDVQVLLIRHVLTHREYDKGDWKKK